MINHGADQLVNLLFFVAFKQAFITHAVISLHPPLALAHDLGRDQTMQMHTHGVDEQFFFKLGHTAFEDLIEMVEHTGGRTAHRFC